MNHSIHEGRPAPRKGHEFLPDDVQVIVTEWSTNLTWLIGITSIFSFDLFRTNIVQTDSRIVRRDQYLRESASRQAILFEQFDRELTRQWFEFIVSIPVILYGFRHFFLDRWLRLPSLSPIFITVWKGNRTSRRHLSSDFSTHIVLQQIVVK